MLTIYGVSIVLCFIKILYGSRKFRKVYILQQFATNICNFTNFKMLSLAVVKYLVVVIHALDKNAPDFLEVVNFTRLTPLVTKMIMHRQ